MAAPSKLPSAEAVKGTLAVRHVANALNLNVYLSQE